MTAWVDINLAPLDGTKVDLWDRAGFRWTDMRYDHHNWLNGEPVTPKEWGPYNSSQHAGGPKPEPTHFSFLPTPPAD